MPYKVTIYVDFLDPNPTVKIFDNWWDSQDYINLNTYSIIEESIAENHGHITDKEWDEIVERESQLVKVEEIEDV